MEFSLEVSVKQNGRNAPQYTIDSDLDGTITFEELRDFMKANLITFAELALREEQSKGFDKEPITKVDGRQNKSVLDVNPFGKIEFFSRANNLEFIEEIYDGIQKRSKVVTGEYKQSNVVIFRENQVANDEASLKAWLATSPDFKPKELLLFVNLAPYARKLERLGVTAQRSTSRDRKKTGLGGTVSKVKAPNGVYYLTWRAVRRKYKANANIRFGFLPGNKLGVTQRKDGRRTTFAKSPKAKKGSSPRTYLYPFIAIVFQEGGSL